MKDPTGHDPSSAPDAVYIDSVHEKNKLQINSISAPLPSNYTPSTTPIILLLLKKIRKEQICVCLND